MNKMSIWYWVFTGLLVIFMGVGAIPDILYAPDAVELFRQLGYPTYLLPFLGFAKLLGLVAILVPGFPRVKEWAYAGLAFDLAGAAYSTLMSGDASGVPFFLIGFAVIAGSYVCYHRKQKTAVAGAVPA
ncbi:DoxX family protein [Cohnella sp. REN36]|uniref:DoxX family protein n=1 Tax=Cohnella sp. REN36 TaxID=2887347 RepID=UPI001D159082|nr:DoxX family protein [Cohnella sp. REN36]MCC3371495.1 DoxX family protein [Cohnella sp. REN36]